MTANIKNYTAELSWVGAISRVFPLERDNKTNDVLRKMGPEV